MTKVPKGRIAAAAAGLLLTAVALLLPQAAGAQELSLSLGEGGSLTGRSVQLIALITVLSVAPGIAVSVTCFPFIVTVLSILRQAIGLQQSPPNMLIVSLALFLTFFVMEPVFTQSWEQGVSPMIAEEMDLPEAFPRIVGPFRAFMAARLDPETYAAMAALRSDGPGPAVDPLVGPDAPRSVLVPSFMLSEIARAFQIGFLVFLPFLIIDLVVAAVLMSMGMMMVPPAIVSLPFKLSFFVLADGWSLIAGSLVRSYF